MEGFVENKTLDPLLLVGDNLKKYSYTLPWCKGCNVIWAVDTTQLAASVVVIHQLVKTLRS